MIQKKYLFFLFVIVAGAHVDCKAQQSSSSSQYHEHNGMKIRVPVVLDLSVSPSTTQTFDFKTTTQIESGITQLVPHKLTYTSNKPFYITIGSTTNFSGGDAQYPMPISMLKYSLSTSNGNWISLSESPQPIGGTPGNKLPRGTGTIDVYFRMEPGYGAYPAQNYTVTISYNILDQ